MNHPMARIELTGFGSVWRVGRIEITTRRQKKSVQLNLPAANYDAAVALAKAQAAELAKSIGYQASNGMSIRGNLM